MGKSRWTKAAWRTTEYDGQAAVVRMNRRLAQDTQLVALVVKNVRPREKGDGYRPFVLVGPLTKMLLRVKYEYRGKGREDAHGVFVGNVVLAGESNGMKVYQVNVASPVHTSEVDDWPTYETWKTALLAQDEDDVQPFLTQERLDVEVRHCIDTLYAAMQDYVNEYAERDLDQRLTVPAGTAGRAPVYA